MPPKRSVAASPAASQRGGSRLAPASPARSTRSMKSHREEEWDNESVQSSFKVPAPRTGRNGLSLHDTSVNIAAAFSAAQSGHLPTPNTSSYHKPPSRPQNMGRALSPAEQLADTARALSPVRYFLHPTDNNDSAEYPSFASLGNQSSNNTSYDYQKEEEYVRNRMKSDNGHASKASESRRRKKAEDGDMPYRPAEDDWAVEAEGSEDEGEGEGIVRSGALDGRASTRGKTKDKGEGYLGMGLGIQPKRKSGRRSGDLLESEGEEDRGISPEPNYSRHGFSRSPTPAQLLRAITPRMSPGPRPVTPRRRQPSDLRTIVTNLLHGLVMALRLVTDLLVNMIDSAVIRPMRLAFGSGKMAVRQIKQNWWKILGGVLATCLLLRLLSRPKMIHIGQVGVNTETADQLASRLSQLERALASLSDNPRLPADHAVNPSSRELTDRISRLEASLADERNHEQISLDSIQRDLGKVVSRVDNHDKTLASAQSRLQTADRLGKDLRALKTRVDAVEVEVRTALDDGRLHKAIERILPEWMPIKRSKGGRIDVEPVFWNEMKKVLVGKGDLDKAVQDALAGRVSGGLNEHDLERFGERLFEQKAAKGLVISRDQFLQAIHNELEDLKARIDRAPPPAKSSSVTIKTQKGDDITSLLQDLIDAAILKYSKDTLATPDYALFTAGARVVPSITSDTLVLKSASTVGKWLAGSRDIEGRSPATALHPDNAVGSCWPFQGSQGQLGILLSRRVVITDVTIEHAAKELSPDTRTAPKTIEIWGLVEGEVNKGKVAEYMATEQALRSKSESTVAPSPDHLLLASVEYDPSADDPTQTFPIPPAIIDLGVDIGIVIFKVESNWGGDLTCLYRVRVHGTKTEELEM